jgi:uncharacterized protein (TIGR01777 family)
VKVVVGGGTGFVGRALVASLAADGHEVVVVTRSPAASGEVAWDAAAGEVDGADAVVNLAGASIGGRRWTRRRKDLIRSSRVETTRVLRTAIEQARVRPHVFVTASGIDFAGDAGDDVVDEDAPYGRSFLAAVCAAWEAAGAAAPVRHVAVRTPLAVGPGAQAVRMLALPYRLFAGGRLGSGRHARRARRAGRPAPPRPARGLAAAQRVRVPLPQPVRRARRRARAAMTRRRPA